MPLWIPWISREGHCIRIFYSGLLLLHFLHYISCKFFCLIIFLLLLENDPFFVTCYYFEFLIRYIVRLIDVKAYNVFHQKIRPCPAQVCRPFFFFIFSYLSYLFFLSLFFPSLLFSFLPFSSFLFFKYPDLSILANSKFIYWFCCLFGDLC